jgi:hypothetical protein
MQYQIFAGRERAARSEERTCANIAIVKANSEDFTVKKRLSAKLQESGKLC